MIRINPIINDKCIVRWKLNKCEERWTKIQAATTYHTADINIISSLFSLYPIKTIIMADFDTQCKIIKHLESDPTLAPIIYEKAISKQKSSLHNIIHDIFVLNGFNKMDKNQFIIDLNLNVCPYCNRNYIGVLKNKNLVIPLDHFIPKSKYPFLAASVNNLFSCCPTCNTGLKLDQDTYTKKVKHPCNADLDKLIFKIKRINKQYFHIIPPADSFKIEVVDFDENSDLFFIKEIYNEMHKDDVIDLIHKKRHYSSSLYKKMITKLPAPLNDKDNLMRFILGTYYNPRDHHKKPLSKFIYDISRQLKIDKF